MSTVKATWKNGQIIPEGPDHGETAPVAFQRLEDLRQLFETLS